MRDGGEVADKGTPEGIKCRELLSKRHPTWTSSCPQAVCNNSAVAQEGKRSPVGAPPMRASTLGLREVSHVN